MGDVGAIIPPTLVGNTTFNIIIMMLHLMDMKNLFGGLPLKDLNKHLKDFVYV